MYDETSIEKLQETIMKLESKVEALTEENKQLKSKLNTESPLLVMGDEQELYPGEIKDIILSTLTDSINEERSRRADVIQDIIDHNDYEKLGKERMNKIKNVLRTYTGMDRKTKASLEEMGIAIMTHNRHYVGTYYNDARYRVIFSATPSDSRAGLNLASNLIRVCL